MGTISSKKFNLARNIAFSSALVLVISGCDKTSEKPVAFSAEDAQALAEKATAKAGIYQDKENIQEGLKDLLEGEYVAATEKFGKALYNDPQNSYLHYLNGLSLQLAAKEGAKDGYDLAEAAYIQAIKFDKANWLAARQLARVEYQKKDYRKAQDHYAQALLFKPKDADLLRELASASYYAQDLTTAHASIQKCIKLSPNDAATQRAAALITAALNKSDRALGHLANYRKLETDKNQVNQLAARIDDWKEAHSNGEMVLAQAAPGKVATAKPAAPASNMIVFDVIILRQSEAATTSKGQNILATGSGGNPFALTLGGSNNTLLGKGGKLQQATQRIFSSVSWPGINYSLNIANAGEQRTEIVERPTLTASIGQKADFFAGQVITQPLVGNLGNGSLTRNSVGIKLEVTPTAIQGDKVTLHVNVAGDSFSTNPETIRDFSNVSPTFINSSYVDSVVQVGFDETIMLAGISEKQDTGTKSGFPVLKDLPIAEYFFGNATTSSARKSVVYMITPRRHEEQAKLTNAYNSFNAKQGHNTTSNLTLFEQRNRDWFKASPNMPGIFENLDALYYEFRTGDMPGVRWDMPNAIYDIEGDLSAFLYF